jgi:hypothetical protein
MKCTIELAPDGGLRLTTPRGKSLDFLPQSATALILLERLLARYEAYGDDGLPTQSQFNGEQRVAERKREKEREQWGMYRGVDWSKPDPTTRTLPVEEPKRKTKPRLSAKAFRTEKKEKRDAMLGRVDLAKVEFTL